MNMKSTCEGAPYRVALPTAVHHRLGGFERPSRRVSSIAAEPYKYKYHNSNGKTKSTKN